MLPFIHILGRPISVYGLCVVAGLLAGGFAACLAGRRRGALPEEFILLALPVVAGAFIGGQLLYALIHAPEFFRMLRSAHGLQLRSRLGVAAGCFGGLVFYGGLFGALAAAAIHARLSRSLDRALIFDVLAVAIPLFHAFGRVGCFFGGCCYGIECEWGVLIRENPVNPEIAGVVRLPVQLIESGCNLALFALMLGLYRRRVLEGRLMNLYLLVYASLRFALEFFRGDAIRGIWLGLSTSQWISLGILGWIACRLVRKRRFPGPQQT